MDASNYTHTRVKSAAGDVVTVTGTVTVDQDFGYAYALLLEKAKLK